MLNPDVASVSAVQADAAGVSEHHKTVDRLRQSSLAPGELRKEIVQLEEENTSSSTKSTNSKKPKGCGFDALLKVTSAATRTRNSCQAREQKIEQGAAYEHAEMWNQ